MHGHKSLQTDDDYDGDMYSGNDDDSYVFLSFISYSPIVNFVVVILKLVVGQ